MSDSPGVYTLPSDGTYPRIGYRSGHPDEGFRETDLSGFQKPHEVRVSGEGGGAYSAYWPHWKPYRYGVSPKPLRPPGPFT